MPATKKRKAEAGDKWIPLDELSQISEKKATPIYLRQHEMALKFVMEQYTKSFRSKRQPQNVWYLILERDLYEYMGARPNVPAETIKRYIDDKGHHYCTFDDCWCQALNTMKKKRTANSFSREICRVPKSSAGLLTHVVDKIMIRSQSFSLLLCARKWADGCIFYAGTDTEVPTLLLPLDIFKYILVLAELTSPLAVLDEKGYFLPWCIPPQEHPDDPDYDDESDSGSGGDSYASDSESGTAGTSDDSE